MAELGKALEDRQVRVAANGETSETRLTLPDGTDLTQWALGFKLEQEATKLPFVWVKFLARTETAK